MNMIQMMFTLKMVGLALDLENCTLAMGDYDNKTDEQKAEIIYSYFNLTVADVFHYSLNYIGIVTGPYFRYRTFLDYIDLPFSKYANCEKHTLKKLRIFPLIAVIFLFLSYYWPISYCTTEEFFQHRSWSYRFWYMWVIFYFYRMRIYCGLILTECICIMAGLGAYPEITRPRSGHGPTDNFQTIYQIAKDTSLLSKTEFNFETVNNIDPVEVDFCITVRAAMKHWNTCIQYWLAVNVYKCFPYKKFRTFATLFVSAYWHGLYLGHYVCIWSMAFYLPIEDLYVNLYLKDNSEPYLKFWKWFIWYMKMQTFGYLCVAMQLLTYENVMRYYNSMDHFWIVALTILYLIGLGIKFKRRVQTAIVDE
ncbi:lysophospholipid acyltransferase 7 isoform X2 [Agrilus planipennis]|nr:lysophospholipid acyltransferase 7 isoform X2 [Agrilus planipennis]